MAAMLEDERSIASVLNPGAVEEILLCHSKTKADQQARETLDVNAMLEAMNSVVVQWVKDHLDFPYPTGKAFILLRRQVHTEAGSGSSVLTDHVIRRSLENVRETDWPQMVYEAGRYPLIHRPTQTCMAISREEAIRQGFITPTVRERIQKRVQKGKSAVSSAISRLEATVKSRGLSLLGKGRGPSSVTGDGWFPSEKDGRPFSSEKSGGLFSSEKGGFLFTCEKGGGLFSPEKSAGLFSSVKSGGLFTSEKGGGLFSSEKSAGLFSYEKDGGLFSSEKGRGPFSSEKGGGLFTSEKGGGLFSSEKNAGLFSYEKDGGLFSSEKGGGPFSSEKDGRLFSSEKGGGLFSSEKGRGLFSSENGGGQSSSVKSTGQSSIKGRALSTTDGGWFSYDTKMQHSPICLFMLAGLFPEQ